MLTFPQSKTFTLISSFFLELMSQGLAPRQSEFRIPHESTSTELTKAQAYICIYIYTYIFSKFLAQDNDFPAF